ncbi:MAG: hypothetical protein U5J95_05405 [Balneolaceae bacterium]|nr:hypothetical protein [Balneolaceae bacterium]
MKLLEVLNGGIAIKSKDCNEDLGVPVIKIVQYSVIDEDSENTIKSIY